jgi:N-acetylmuramoyl-L-alanine amidase
MKLAPAFIQTKIILYLPFVLALFNISLASANNNGPNPSSEKTERGKGIKDTQLQKTDYQIKTIVIDAGHGGHDPGCSGKNSREKHLALGVALKLAKNVREKHPNVNVILTRDADVFIPLHKRAAIANSNNADLFISIHCNYMPKLSYVQGSETYVMGLHTAEHNLDVAKRENSSILLEDNYEKNYDYDPNSPEGHIILSMFQNVFLAQSILFAEKVENMIHSSASRKSRGVKQAGFVVLKETTMLSVLI